MSGSDFSAIERPGLVAVVARFFLERGLSFLVEGLSTTGRCKASVAAIGVSVTAEGGGEGGTSDGVCVGSAESSELDDVPSLVVGEGSSELPGCRAAVVSSDSTGCGMLDSVCTPSINLSTPSLEPLPPRSAVVSSKGRRCWALLSRFVLMSELSVSCIPQLISETTAASAAPITTNTDTEKGLTRPKRKAEAPIFLKGDTLCLLPPYSSPERIVSSCRQRQVTDALKDYEVMLSNSEPYYLRLAS